MRDPCRICGVRVVGNQCRWIFSPAAKSKLQIILSHVLGWEVTRDGRGEFLCGKCVFQLEKVVQCDINISQLEDEHNAKVQRLLAEKDHLIQCIIHVYKKTNPSLEKTDGESSSGKTLLSCGMGSPYEEASEGQPFKERGSAPTGSRMKRCVSLDQIASKGAFPGRSGLRKSRLGSVIGLDASMKTFTIRGSRHRSESMYIDLVQRKGMLPRPGFKGRSTSLQSLNRDFSSDSPPDPPPKAKQLHRESKIFTRRDDSAGKLQAQALLRRSSNQPSVISDLIQLLRCISKQQISAPAGSHIPVLKRLNTGNYSSRARHRYREAQWKSLQDLTEEFDDKYTPLRVKVVLLNNKEGKML